MSEQNGDQKLSPEPIYTNLNMAPVVDIEPIQLLQVTGCTAGNQDMFNSMQMAVDCACSTAGVTASLCRAVMAGNVAFTEPFSCMIDLIENHATCDVDIPTQKRQQAYQAFSEVTGFKQANLASAFNTLSDENRQLVEFNVLYIFLPIFILIFIVIWLLVGFNWINWVVGLYLTVLTFIILYGFAIFYRIQTDNFINSRNKSLQNTASDAQKNFENSVAYWPQGLFAVACAVTSTGTTGWVCNEPGDCPTCAKPAQAQGCGNGRCMGKSEEQEQKLVNDNPTPQEKEKPIPQNSRDLRRRRVPQRKR